MKFNSNHNKIIHYNFPTFDSKNQSILPKTFFNFKIYIPSKINNIKINNSNNKIICNSILDSGSICNFISKNFVNQYNLKTKNTKNSIIIKGISGTTIINEFVELKFKFFVKIQNKFYLLPFKEKFLVTDKIPIDILIGNTFIRKFELHYNYKNNFIYTNMAYTQFCKLNFSKNFSNSKNYKNFKNKLKNSKIFANLNNLNYYVFEHNKNFSKLSTNENHTNHNYKNFNNNYYNNNNNRNFINKNINHNDFNYFSTNFKNSNIKNDGLKNSLYYPNSYINNSSIKSNSPLYYLNNLSNSILKSGKFSKIKNFKNNSEDKYFVAFISKKNNKISRRNNKYNYNIEIYSFLSNNEEYYDDEDDENEEEDKLEDIPPQYRDIATVFSKKEADKLPPHRPVDCKIVLQKGATLHYGPIYPISEEESKVLKEYIEENLKKGFIRPSESPAGYPVLFQLKKDGTLRLCVDYKKLNEVTIRNSYPIPLISEIIEKVKDAKYFTKLDLRSAYNLVRIHPGDEYKTAFRTKYGHFEYLVMPFGLRNAPATFQSFINMVLRPFLEKFVILYLDDILIYSKTKEEHHQQVHQVLEKLLENGLYAKLKKCEFDKDKVEFLGYVLSGEGIATDPKKISSIKEWPKPTCVKDVQRFVGLCNYYRRFVKNFAMLAKPLHNLTKKNSKFIWTDACEKSFNELKNRLITSPILMHPNPEKPYIVECDSSNYAIGAILSQKDENNKLHPVAYYSRSLNNAEINYSITDKELLAIKSAFSTWRHLLLGAKHQITVFTDHRNLLYTLGGKIGNQRQHRWHLFFQQYNFQLIYRQGRKNGKPDSLSRRPDYMVKPEVVKEEFILDSKNIKEVPCFIGIMSELIDKIIQETKEDSFAKRIFDYFSSNNSNLNDTPFRNMNKFKINNNMILYNNLIYIPYNLRTDILKKYHDSPSSGHLGIKRTEELITRNYWWPELHKDVKDYVKSCEICARSKYSRHKRYDYLRPLEVPDRPWKSIEIDFLCGLPNSRGYTIIMVIVDRFSKMIHLKPFRDLPNTKRTAKAFMDLVFKLHGLPSDIYTDRGSQFTSSLWKKIMDNLKIKTKIATTDHHETVGQVERNNSYIEQYLRAYSKSYTHKDWVDWLYLAEFAYNNAIHESTNETPFFINYGFHPSMDDLFLFENNETNNLYIKNINDNFIKIKNILNISIQKYKKYADKRRTDAPELSVGNFAWVNPPPSFKPEFSKLSPCKYGPFRILEKLENNNYKIDISNSPFPKAYPIFHISELEPYFKSPLRFKRRNNN